MSQASDRLAADLRRDILRGQYRTGERFPSERDLATKHNVNRATAREACKQLEALGLIRVKRGDGARVEALNDAHLNVTRFLLQDYGNLAEVLPWLLDMHEAWFVAAAHFATERGTAAERHAWESQIEAALKAGTTALYFQRLDELLNAMFSAAANPIFHMARLSLQGDVFSALPDGGARLRPPQRLFRSHAPKLSAAMRKGDALGAGQALRMLLRDNRERVLAHYGELGQAAS